MTQNIKVISYNKSDLSNFSTNDILINLEKKHNINIFEDLFIVEIIEEEELSLNINQFIDSYKIEKSLDNKIKKALAKISPKLKLKCSSSSDFIKAQEICFKFGIGWNHSKNPTFDIHEFHFQHNCFFVGNMLGLSDEEWFLEENEHVETSIDKLEETLTNLIKKV